MTAGTVEAELSYLGRKLPIATPSMDACTLSADHPCPLEATEEPQALTMEWEVPRLVLPCPINKDGGRDNCYTLSLNIKDQDKDTVACVDIGPFFALCGAYVDADNPLSVFLVLFASLYLSPSPSLSLSPPPSLSLSFSFSDMTVLPASPRLNPDCPALV